MGTIGDEAETQIGAVHRLLAGCKAGLARCGAEGAAWRLAARKFSVPLGTVFRTRTVPLDEFVHNRP